MNYQERKAQALKRIEELRLLIHHWDTNEKQKQVRQERGVSSM